MVITERTVISDILDKLLPIEHSDTCLCGEPADMPLGKCEICWVETYKGCPE